MAKEPKIDSSKLTDEQLLTQAITFGFDIHHPNRIPIGDILTHRFGCDYLRKEIIRQQIVDHGIARYADADEADLLLNSIQVKAIESGNPIEYMEEWRESQKSNNSINIHAPITGAMIGHNAHLGGDFKPSIHEQNKNVADEPIQKKKAESSSLIPDWAKILGGLAAIAGLAKVIIELAK